MKWISVKEKLPKLSTPMEIKRVLVWRERSGVCMGWRTEFQWYIDGSPSDWTDEIFYWMPLPKRPRQLKKEEDKQFKLNGMCSK